ncbi:MAG TPA: ketoacyl-ACP synthase III [Candidatus Aminicenantes bacterium]|nr:ketoacyl-ACP synthase III [Candidatus Aminicenantes bacterium]HRY65738.1 ketoacyl-ACP synthase III [Candidatus Aminicenantes bacterium]HRZ72652.1 ketoacyl-ACP synthase III [Candidatus Aminicenantes bacterium]
MNLRFSNKAISGILTVVPAREVAFEQEMANYNFSPAKCLKLKLAMGYGKHRIVAGDACASDLCVRGLTALFDRGLLKKDEIDALILVTQSPDHFMPPTSNIIQGRLGLKRDLLCLDICQGCAGFVIGLVEAFMLLEQEAIRKVVLLNADVLSRRVSPRDRNSFPLIGDAASVTIVEKDPSGGPIHANLKMDGSQADALMIPAGGFRCPSSPETARLEEDENGNFRAKDHLVMKGDAVFNFVQTEVPPMIAGLMNAAGADPGSVDYFMFHQPNRFMLRKLADKMQVGYEKMPSNIVENFGNSSGVTIPLAVTFNAGERLLRERLKICLAGFGVGLTWASILMNVGPLAFCEMIEYD